MVHSDVEDDRCGAPTVLMNRQGASFCSNCGESLDMVCPEIGVDAGLAFNSASMAGITQISESNAQTWRARSAACSGRVAAACSPRRCPLGSRRTRCVSQSLERARRLATELGDGIVDPSMRASVLGMARLQLSEIEGVRVAPRGLENASPGAI